MDNNQNAGTQDTTTGGDQTPNNEQKSPEQIALEAKEAELAELKRQNASLQEQKEHWREKYDKDIGERPNPSSSMDISNSGSDDDVDDTRKRIVSLENQVRVDREERTLEKLQREYPALGDKLSEFKDFREEKHPRMELENAVKIFLVENNLLGTVKQVERPGLEKPSGGSRTPAKPGMSKEDVKNLRENDYRRYERMIINGEIKPDDIA